MVTIPNKNNNKWSVQTKFNLYLKWQFFFLFNIFLYSYICREHKRSITNMDHKCCSLGSLGRPGNAAPRNAAGRLVHAMREWLVKKFQANLRQQEATFHIQTWLSSYYTRKALVCLEHLAENGYGRCVRSMQPAKHSMLILPNHKPPLYDHWWAQHYQKIWYVLNITELISKII